MRSVERGTVPLDKNGNAVQFKEYGDARDDLIKRLGDYCSYCESPLLAPAVEHVQPKSLVPTLQTDWDNFLLACTYCNSNKGNKPVNASNLHDYFWADSDNTFRAFRYEQHRAPQVLLSLNLAQQKIALDTLELTGLDREPSHPQLSKKDRRWIKRKDAWDKAEQAKLRLSRCVTNEMREQIIDTATSTGFWSVWMTVFQNDTNMRQRLINAFIGTSAACFNVNSLPVQRTNGQI